MRLLRVRVPDFRALKDVDITFEKDFIPSIFPLGSQNGGGKSTLLQLIFVLLHCSSNPELIPFLKNIANGFKVYKNTDKRVLAIIDIWDETETIQLEFFSCQSSYIERLVNLSYGDKEQEKDIFTIPEELEQLRKKMLSLRQERDELEESKAKTKNSYDREFMEGQIHFLEEEFLKKYSEYQKILRILENVTEQLKKESIIYLTTYYSTETENEKNALLCYINNIETTKIQALLQKISTTVFLAAPSTQVFIFLSKQARRLLFKEEVEQSSKNSYYSYLKTAKSKLAGLFLYDFLAVDLIVNSFKLARDKDFKEAIEKGEYGNNYKALLNDLNCILGNKQLNLKTDLSGVAFKINKDNEDVELAPEDLSHGELKRLSIYMWLKYHNIEDAIVLMDEIEIAFHPDWQYQIVSDLNQWAPSNQYILATHSFELCQALTPAHVKELEPKLLKQSSTQV